ncbi:hypothetical protein HHK36_021887 [Tetracentron sinense]|uniref:BRCT domain-containing protein n=1 Tax=Tetracentron sinense TaxID=13715 RepID=A0A834YW22_TETSI|nr:hypothetical protein HHK36_021887 [Tetracentron sinense]
MAGGRVEVVGSKGCSRLLIGISSALPSLGFQSLEPMSPASSVVSEPGVRASRPFADLVICVTGLSKGLIKLLVSVFSRPYGSAVNLYCHGYNSVLSYNASYYYFFCFGGRKFEHALKHGPRNGLFVVTLGWFLDSIRRNVRLSESLYSVQSVGENGLRMEELNRLLGFTSTEKSCLPVAVHEVLKQSNTIHQPHLPFSGKESRSRESILSGQSIYVDSDISAELQSKVVEAAAREGATFVDHWFIGCSASHVVCEGPFIWRYLGHTNNIVTPLWILKTAKEKFVQRLVHISSDLARQVSTILEDFPSGIAGQDPGKNKKSKVIKEKNVIDGPQDELRSRECRTHKGSSENPNGRQQIVNLAKTGVRNRRGRRMQTCQTPIRPITPTSLLDSICWSISEPTSAACIYTDSSGFEDVSEQNTSLFIDARGDGRELEASFENFSRPLRESEKAELIYKNHFLTILFPIDRFGEMGPSSRTFFSDKGFTCLQVLDHIYTFYQENMAVDEVDSAIHTDSRHADRLRTAYASKETAECGYVQFKRIDFLGSRRSFEMLKRVSGDNSNVYELLIRA